MAKAAYRPQLDGVRAFCIIFTIFNHVPRLPWFLVGSVGVDVFFALSGWLITWLLLAEREREGAISLGSFYIRRIFRILPLYYLTLALYMVSSLLVGDLVHQTQLWRGFPYLATFNAEYRGGGDTAFGQAWTLGIEEKFYLIWPLIIKSLGRRPAVAVAVASACVAVLLFLAADREEAAMVIRGYLGLGSGTVAALVVYRHQTFRRWLEQHPLEGPALLFMAASYAGALFFPHPYLWNVAVAVSATPLIASLWFAGEKGWTSRILSITFLAWVGRLTYAIYLLHILVKSAAEMLLVHLSLPSDGWVLFALTYAGSIAAAWIVHITIEAPLIEVGRRLSRRHRARLDRRRLA